MQDLPQANSKVIMEIDVPKIDQFWEDQMVNSHSHSGSSGHLQYERNLNFATVAVEDGEYGYPKKKTVRDPLSHRIIEKRRRDRMNNCLADLARLLPAASLRKGRGRIEKTEIVELAIKHLKHLQMHPCPQSDTCEFNQMARNQKSQSKASSSSSSSSGSSQSTSEDNFRLGYQECLSEIMHFLVETEGMYSGDAICVRLVKHLNNHCEDIMRNHTGGNGKISLGFPLNSRKMIEAVENFKKSGSPSSGSGSGSGYQANGSSSSPECDANVGNDGDGSLGNEQYPSPPANQYCNGTERNAPNFDYEGDNNSCSSNPLSVEISEILSSDGKNTNRSTKPPIPKVIYSGNSSSNSRSPAVMSSSNGRSSDESGSSANSLQNRYKFKNNINKRFNADLQTKHDNEEAENDVYSEENEQNMEERNKQEVDGANMTMSSNSSNPDSEPPSVSNDVAAVANVTSAEPGEMTVALPSNKIIPSIVIPLITTTDEKQNEDDCEKKLGAEELLVPSPVDGLLLKKTCSLPLINAAALISGEESSPLPLAASPLTGVGVPAFALHDKGLYYIPLTIDKSIVSPFIAAMEPNTQPPLHPVTISVSFLFSDADKNKIKGSPLDLEKIALPIPVSVPLPIAIPLPVTVANITPISPLRPRGLPRDQAFIMNRFTQSQQVNPKSSYNSGGNGSNNGYRYPIGLNGSGGSISSGSYSPNNSLISYPVFSGSSINFGSHNSHGSLSSYNSSNSSHHLYYNNSSSSGSNSSGGNNSDSSTKALRNNINAGTIHDSNKSGTNINIDSPNESSSSGNGSSNVSTGSSGHGHPNRSNRTTGSTPGGRNRKRSISSSPSVSGSGVSSSTGYQSWYEKAPSSSSADGIYSNGISMSLNSIPEQQSSNYTDNPGHHYGHHSANHLHPHSHGHSHIHPQYSHGHSHGHAITHHGNHYDDKEQSDRNKGRSSPNKRIKKSRVSLDQEIQHKHILNPQSGSIHR